MSASFRDARASFNTQWIHDLARAETHPEADKLMSESSAYDPNRRIQEATHEFMQEVKEAFTEYSRAFNAYSENGTKFADLKIYSVAQTECDFMLFRNQLKLVVSNISHGVISFSFSKHIKSHYVGTESEKEFPPAQELLAELGPFRDVKWMFRGQHVEAYQVAKFYFAEFLRITRQKNATHSQAVLLEQIKSLLQERGIDLSPGR